MTRAAKRRSRRSSGINVTPLIDVLLVLVAVLLLAMPLVVKKLPVELPRTELGGLPLPINALPLALTRDGQLVLKGAVTPEEAVLAVLDGSVSIQLAVEKEVSYEKLAKVLTKLQSKGPKEIALLTQ